MWNLLVILIFSFNFPVNSKSKEENACALSAVYLTIGQEAFNEMHLWGGNHVTLAGFHPCHSSEAFMLKIPQILKERALLAKGWKPKKLKVEKRGKYWVLILHSKTLNTIVKALHKQGFQKLKGPEYSKSEFHMVLSHIHTKEEAEAYVKTLNNQQWFINIARKDSFIEPMKWLEYYPL